MQQGANNIFLSLIIVFVQANKADLEVMPLIDILSELSLFAELPIYRYPVHKRFEIRG